MARSAAAAALAAGPGFAASPRSNVLLIMADDLGFSDLGAFGSEIATPNLDALAARGAVMTAMYASPMPHISHAEVLFGVDHHFVINPAPGAASVGALACLAEPMRDAGYHTYMIGTWDVGAEPKARGFERSHALMSLAGDYYPPTGADLPTPHENFRYLEDGAAVPPPEAYIADVWTDKLIGWLNADAADGRPFFAYAAYTTPHFPLQAPAEAIARQRGRYDAGYDAIRLARIARQKKSGLIAADMTPSVPVPTSLGYKTWDQLSDAEKQVEARRMEIYAAMIETLDSDIGRLLAALKAGGRDQNTLIVFTSCNGGAQAVTTHRSLSGIDNSLANMGARNSWISYAERWAEVSNAPFSHWKAKASEGGVSVPTIVRRPGQLSGGRLDAIANFRDLSATVLAAAGLPARTAPPEARLGVPLDDLWSGKAARVHAPDEVLIEEYRDEAYVRQGRWKALLISATAINAFDAADAANAEYIAAVQAGDTAKAAAIRARHPSVWKLYDIEADRGETTDLAAEHPEVLKTLVGFYDAYCKTWAPKGTA
jgi:arylsulfatase A-like enzyme